MMMKTSDSFTSYTFKWTTPDGQAFINIIETSPITIQINIGKAGTSVAGWAYALAELVNVVLKYEPIDTVIEVLENITTQQSVTDIRGIQCRSTAEAVGFALTEYGRMKLKEARKG